MPNLKFRDKSITDKLTMLAFALTGILVLLYIRYLLFYFQSGDYIMYTYPWILEYQSMTFIEGLAARVGNYNHPYMYILNIIARFGNSGIFLIKAVSVFFDLLLAYFVMKIISLKTESLNIRILAFFLIFALPTVILNSSMWGQCDSIYASFIVGSFYFALRGRSKSAYAFLALAVSFKAQAVFLLPVFPFLIINKKITLRDCYIFFIVYFSTFIPALLAGRSFIEMLLTYIDQVGFYAALNMNAINIWLFIENVNYERFSSVGMFATGFVILGLMYFTWVNRVRLTGNLDYVRLAYLSAVIMPFLLPKMHDRYFFIADVLSVVLFIFDKRRWYVPVVTVSCSFLAYAAYLMWDTFVDLRLAVPALLFVIIVVLKDYVTSLYPANTNCDHP